MSFIQGCKFNLTFENQCHSAFWETIKEKQYDYFMFNEII